MFEKLFGFAAVPLGSILNWVYENIAFQNYGLAIILFTLIIKLALLPITIKQQKSTVGMQKLQPQLDELKNKYKDDPQKFNMESFKLYKENNVSPAMGCFTMLIQMPILFSLFFVISKPLTYMRHMSVGDIAKLAREFNVSGLYREIGILAHNKMLNMNFLGLDLTKIPTLNFVKIFGSPNTVEYLVLILLPILATLTTYFAFKLATNKIDVPDDSESGIRKHLKNFPVIMTAIFSFNVPAGLAIYWIIDNLFKIGQEIYINKYVLVDYKTSSANS